MPTYESPALYIDFSRMPPPKVIEEIDYEVLHKRAQTRVVERLPALKRAMELEQSPSNVILEVESYGEMIVRQRINAAARATMLPYATGADLDNLAAFFQQGGLGVARLALVANPRPWASYPGDWESDAAFRRRIQYVPEAYASAGSQAAYLFHALTAAPTLRDASAIRVDDRGMVRVTLLASGKDPQPTQAQIDAVRARLNLPEVKPLTDSVAVTAPKVFSTEIAADIDLYPGPDAARVMDDIATAIKGVVERTSILGRDLTRSMLVSAIGREGVVDVRLKSPAADIVCDLTQCVLVTNATINPSAQRRE